MKPHGKHGISGSLLLALKLEITVDAPQFIVKPVVVVVVVGFQDLQLMSFFKKQVDVQGQSTASRPEC